MCGRWRSRVGVAVHVFWSGRGMGWAGMKWKGSLSYWYKVRSENFGLTEVVSVVKGKNSIILPVEFKFVGGNKFIVSSSTKFLDTWFGNFLEFLFSDDVEGMISPSRSVRFLFFFVLQQTDVVWLKTVGLRCDNKSVMTSSILSP